MDGPSVDTSPPPKPVLTHGWLDPHTNVEKKILHTDGLAQDWSHSSALAMELLKFCDEPSIQSELNLKKIKIYRILFDNEVHKNFGCC